MRNTPAAGSSFALSGCSDYGRGWKAIRSAHAVTTNITTVNPRKRRVEVTHLRRRDVDLFNRVVNIGRSKSESSQRRIPLDADALSALKQMLDRADNLGFTAPDHYLWFACQWNRMDPTKSMEKWDTAWRAVREHAKLAGLRFHDLRHTAIAELAEMGTPDSVLKSIAGHITQRMLDHYSHIRMTAKRQALDGLGAFRADELLRALGRDVEVVQ